MNISRNVVASLAAVVCVVGASGARAAEQNRTYLTTRFQDGDIPSGQDFADTIDSALNLVDDGLTSYRVGVFGSTGAALRLGAGDVIGPALSWMPTAIHPHPALAPLWLGQTGFLPMEFLDAGGLSHYGYFQLSMAGGPFPPVPGSPGPAITVEYLVWQTDAGVPITAHVVPGPGGAAVVVGGLLALAQWRRRGKNQ